MDAKYLEEVGGIMGIKLSSIIAFLAGSISGLGIWALITGRLDPAVKYQVAGYGCAIVYGLIFLVLLYHISKLVKNQCVSRGN